MRKKILKKLKTIQQLEVAAGSDIFDDSTSNIPQLDGSALIRSSYQCDECEFRSSDEKSLKTHKTKKHKPKKSKGNMQRRSNNIP